MRSRILPVIASSVHDCPARGEDESGPGRKIGLFVRWLLVVTNATPPLVWLGFRNAMLPFAFRAPCGSLMIFFKEQEPSVRSRPWYEQSRENRPGKGSPRSKNPCSHRLQVADPVSGELCHLKVRKTDIFRTLWSGVWMAGRSDVNGSSRQLLGC